MGPVVFKNLPSFIRHELEIITNAIQPKMKKFSKYRFFSIPLIIIPAMNLLMLLIAGEWYVDSLPILSIYALMAAIGMALYKESKVIQKEIEKISVEHMIKRINKSELLNEHSKKNYIETIKSQPKISFQAFMEFLNEEHERKGIFEN